jgi:hypothetical protein
MKTTYLLVVCGLVLLLAATVYPFGAPREINYQGILKDSSGDPITTEKNITFTIYDNSTGGNPVWTETHALTPDANGGVCLILGKVSTLADSAISIGNRWLAIKIEDDAEMAQRTKLVSSPYAMRVGSVHEAEAGVLHGQLLIEQSLEPSGDAPGLCLVGAAADQVCLAPAGEGSVLSATNLAGTEVFSMSVDTELPFFVARGPGGDETVIGAASVTVYNGSKGSKIAELSQDGIKLFSSSSGNPLVELQETAEGAVVRVRQGTGATERQLSISDAGAVFMSNGGADTNCVVTNSGDIISNGQIAIGEGNVAGWMGSKAKTWAVVLGYNNTASGDSSVVSGGYNNIAAGRMSAVGGGLHNTITENGYASTISGGHGHYIDSAWCSIGGGHSDTASGQYATVAGGAKNAAMRWAATASGGTENKATGAASTIGGGHQNEAFGSYAVISGGLRNKAHDLGAILGGRDGDLDPSYGGGVILGGVENKVRGNFSVCSGWKGIANHENCFVVSSLWGQLPGDSVWTSGHGQIILAGKNSGLYVTNAAGQAAAPDGNKLIQTNTGAYLTTSGVWTDAPKYRGDKQPVNGNVILGKLEQIPVNRWNTDQENSVQHIGPSPEDFYSAFGLGEDGQSMSAMDIAGVALAAVKELQRKTAELEQLRARLDANETIMAELAAQLQVILAEQNESGSSHKTALAVNQ